MAHGLRRHGREESTPGHDTLLLVLAALALAWLMSVVLTTPAHGVPALHPDLEAAASAPSSGAPPPAAARGAERIHTLRDGVARAPAAYDEIGGDDVAVTTGTTLSNGVRHPLAFASDGTAFAVVEYEVDVTTAYLGVYRSTDAGRSWSLWGTIGGGAGIRCEDPALRVAEGTQDRVYIAFRLSFGSAGAIVVDWSPLTVSAAHRTTVTALSAAGVDFSDPSLESDAVTEASYVLHLVATGQDADGKDIWYTRSTTYGDSWEAGYRVGDMPLATRDYWLPEVKAGWGGYVHCVFNFSTEDGSADWAVRYRRAPNRGADGAASWGPYFYMTSSIDGRNEMHPTVAASWGNMWTVVGWQKQRSDGLVMGTGLKASSDAGANWLAAFEDSIPGVHAFGVKALPGVEGWIGAGQTTSSNFGVLRASNGLPLSWSAFQSFSDRSYLDSYAGTCTQLFDFDPAHQNRVGMVWPRVDAGVGDDTLFFDAEWHRDPGWPNLEAGMPVALPSAPYSAPAVAELDGDAESEIVYSDAAADVWVRNHDGTAVAGWPRNVGSLTAASEVAVGDLDGDGRNEVVAGNGAGLVYAWRHDGTPLTGWPVDVGTGAQCYVSIGALLPDSPRQVVVTSGTRETVLLFSGATAPGWPSNKVATFYGPAAIGDVDGDGAREVVVLFGSYMNVHGANGVIRWFRNLASVGKSFTGPPSLGDLDVNGDLEIVAPTAQGDVYAFHHDGTDVTGWPWSDGTAHPITQIALGHIWSGMQPEVAFTVYDAVAPHTHLLSYSGASIGTWPNETGASWFSTAPIIDNTAGPPYIWMVFAGSRDRFGYAWQNNGALVPGWPRSLAGRATYAPASGDLDADGWLELVYLTEVPSQMVVVDLGCPVYRVPSMLRSWWPMIGYNHERQSCLACGTDAVVGVSPGDPDLPLYARFDPPLPNPAHGDVVLRFALPDRVAARLEVYDVQGRMVRSVLRRELEPGAHQARWDGCDAGGAPAGAGVFFARLTLVGPSGERTLVRRMVRLR